MQSLWLSLEENSILTETNISSFRQYIAQKFPTHSAASKANILADTIHRHINKYLPLLDEHSLKHLRMQLLKTASSQSSFRIVVLDIFKACLELSSGKCDIMEPLEQWLQLQAMNRSPEELAPFTALIEKAVLSQFQNQGKVNPAYVSILNYESNSLTWYQQLLQVNFKRNLAILLIGLMLISIDSFEPIAVNLHSNLPIKTEQLTNSEITVRNMPTKQPIVAANELTSRYSYSEVAKEPLRLWLIKRNSLLAEDPYLSTILETAMEYNIHPFLLFAIAGQEQSLVPQSKKNALKIANNPFNVHHSWESYNTNIADSSQIAAKTILKLVKGRPKDIQPLVWINRKYAEDSKWHLGVEAFFNQMLLIKDKSS